MFKQLFCTHTFVKEGTYKTYLTVGDEANERVSKKEVMTCVHCGKEQTIITKWSDLDGSTD